MENRLLRLWKCSKDYKVSQIPQQVSQGKVQVSREQDASLHDYDGPGERAAGRCQRQPDSDPGASGHPDLKRDWERHRGVPTEQMRGFRKIRHLEEFVP